MQMQSKIALVVAAAIAAAFMMPENLEAQRRRKVVVRRGPVVRTTVVLRPGHPIARSVNRTVVIHPARTVVAVRAPLVFLPLVAFTAVAISLPPKDRLVWQDTDTIDKEEDWTDSNFGVRQRGDALMLDIDGRAQLDFAEVTFENGNVQVVDFNERVQERGLIRLLDFADGRRVMTVRLVARSRSDETRFTLYLRK
jgi:hypothetical protein